MAIIVVGGHSRNVGKTSVVAGLIAALSDYHWTALKITQYGHGICSANGKVCQCATSDHTWAISEETNRAGKSDTSRFLHAGANRVWWVRTRQSQLARALPAIRKAIAGSRNVILESNSILQFLQPDLYLTVLDPSTEDFKKTAAQFLERADAIILHGSNNVSWQGVSLNPSQAVFRIQPPPYLTPAIVEFVETRLSKSSEASALPRWAGR